MVCRILSRRNPPLKAGKGRAGALADIAVWAESARLPPFGAGRKRLLPAGASAPLHIKKRCRDAAVQPLGRLERSHQRLLMVAYSIPFQNPAPALLPPWRRPSDRTPRRRGVRPPPVPVCAGPARGAAELRGAAGSGPRGLGQKGDRTRRSTRTRIGQTGWDTQTGTPWSIPRPARAALFLSQRARARGPGASRPGSGLGWGGPRSLDQTARRDANPGR